MVVESAVAYSPLLKTYSLEEFFALPGEIVSPGNRLHDQRTKSQTDAILGVRELWLIDPETATIEVRTLRDGACAERRSFQGTERLASGILPQLEVSPWQLFGNERG
jgi:Uma2 family endonuclease